MLALCMSKIDEKAMWKSQFACTFFLLLFYAFEFCSDIVFPVVYFILFYLLFLFFYCNLIYNKVLLVYLRFLL